MGLCAFLPLEALSLLMSLFPFTSGSVWELIGAEYDNGSLVPVQMKPTTLCPDAREICLSPRKVWEQRPELQAWHGRMSPVWSLV